MKLLNDYFKIQKEIYNYFGYEDTCEGLSFDDNTHAHWHVRGDDVNFADSIKELEDEVGNYYEEEIVGGIYEGANYTLIPIRDCCGGDNYLSIFDNKKRIKNN